MRRELKVAGIVAAGGKAQNGKAIYVKARAILALTTISTLMPNAFVCDCHCAPRYVFLVRAKGCENYAIEKKTALPKTLREV